MLYLALINYDRFPFNDEEHVEFSKLTQNKIIGTKGGEATVSYNLNYTDIVMQILKN